MSDFFNWLKRLFSDVNHQDSLDAFIASKRPTNGAEVEYWIQYYDQHKHNGWVV